MENYPQLVVESRAVVCEVWVLHLDDDEAMVSLVKFEHPWSDEKKMANQDSLCLKLYTVVKRCEMEASLEDSRRDLATRHRPTFCRHEIRG